MDDVDIQKERMDQTSSSSHAGLTKSKCEYQVTPSSDHSNCQLGVETERVTPGPSCDIYEAVKDVRHGLPLLVDGLKLIGGNSECICKTARCCS